MSKTQDNSFPTTTTLTQQALNRAGEVLTGGALGYFTLPPEVDIVIREGHGAYVTDIEGRKFIDYVLGSGPMLLGHANEQVLAAVDAQLKLGTSYYFLNAPAIE